MKPQIAVLTVADAMAKGFALCGLIAFALHWRSFGKPRSHSTEYFWLLLGCAVNIYIFLLSADVLRSLAIELLYRQAYWFNKIPRYAA